MARPSVSATTLVRSSASGKQEQDLLAREEPLELRLEFGPENNREQVSLSVTMRTPGHDLELATGFLFTEGIITKQEDLLSVRYCQTADDEERENVVKAYLAPKISFDRQKQVRNFYTTSSCGVCGKSSLEAVEVECRQISSDLLLPEKHIHAAPDQLREAQHLFEYTGGLHAAGLFDASGHLLLMREDVGRHNALDKLIGSEWWGKNRFSDSYVLLSGRASFELVQKAARAGVPVLAAVGAPSDLAVDLAKKMGITLLGFVRNNSFNCYSYPERIDFI